MISIEFWSMAMFPSVMFFRFFWFSRSDFASSFTCIFSWIISKWYFFWFSFAIWKLNPFFLFIIWNVCCSQWLLIIIISILINELDNWNISWHIIWCIDLYISLLLKFYCHWWIQNGCNYKLCFHFYLLLISVDFY